MLSDTNWRFVLGAPLSNFLTKFVSIKEKLPILLKFTLKFDIIVLKGVFSLMLEIYDISIDKVIESKFINVKVSYEYALDNFYPRISELDFQRNPLNKKFYERLEDDIVSGCVMPSITIAIMDEYPEEMISEQLECYLQEKIQNSFVLDGIQRLSTLKRASKKQGFDKSRPLFVDILICKSMNKLLYRMITLNNGQKPMSARHQIEILASKLINFEEFDIEMISEKNSISKYSHKISLDQDDVIKAYLAFMSSSVNIDNQKIIADRMDVLLTDKIMQSDLNHREVEFSAVLNFVSKHMKASPYLKKWFEIPNNLIGFSASSSINFNKYIDTESILLEQSVQLFEQAFKGIDVSKIQLGKARRRMVEFYFNKFDKLSQLTNSDLLDRISQEI